LVTAAKPVQGALPLSGSIFEHPKAISNQNEKPIREFRELNNKEYLEEAAIDSKESE
jgi:hypothetical protein